MIARIGINKWSRSTVAAIVRKGNNAELTSSMPLVSLQRLRSYASPIQKPYKSDNEIESSEKSLKTSTSRSRPIPSSGYWSHMENQRAFFDRLASRLDIKSFEDWYGITVAQVKANGGSGLLRLYYGDSLRRALQAIYPEHPWKFASPTTASTPTTPSSASQSTPEAAADDALSSPPASHHDQQQQQHQQQQQQQQHGRYSYGHWKDKENHRIFFDQLAIRLGVQKWPDDWYNVSVAQVRIHGGAGLLQHYDNSVYLALRAIYPEHRWEPWRFFRVQHSNFGSSEDDLRSYLEYLARELGIKDLSEWYRVGRQQIKDLGSGFHIIAKHGGLYKALKKVYPDFAWDKERLQAKGYKKSSQRWLRVVTQQLFPDSEVLEDYLHPQLAFKESDYQMQLDVYVPSKQLAFEFHGAQHFVDIGFFKRQAEYQSRDEEKVLACARAGITLIVVPFWWDRSVESLAATIHQHRPDLIPQGPPSGAVPIPMDITRDMKLWSKADNSPVLLAGTWRESMDPTGWWMSEKLDGVRAYWDGEKLYSKYGKTLHAPQHFIDALPKDQALDGELWMGRGRFQEVMTIGSSANHPAWPHVTYVVFDAPNMPGPFEARYEALRQTLSKQPILQQTTAAAAAATAASAQQQQQHASAQQLSPSSSMSQPQVRLLEFIRCRGREHLMQYMKDITSEGGEGVMLREPGSLYQRGRSSSLLKVKPMQDTEVRFLQPHSNSWALLCEQPNGQHCVVSCPSDVYRNPPPVGSIITVKHDGHWKSGKLRYPYFVRLRGDASSWNDIVREYHQHQQLQPTK